MSSVEERFRTYYEEWVNKLEAHLSNLVIDRHPNHNIIIAALTTHHKDYYAAKWALAHDDIVAFFSPQWLSPFESALSWVTGWKPSTAFQLVDSLRRTRTPLTSLTQLTEDQAQRISELRAKMKAEEGRVERELERQQVALGDRNLSHLAQVAGRGGDNEPSRVEGPGPVKGVLDGLEKVMKMGDYARLKTLKGILDVLTPKQGVDFLAVFAMIHLQMRKWGKQRSVASSATTTSLLDATLIH